MGAVYGGGYEGCVDVWGGLIRELVGKYGGKSGVFLVCEREGQSNLTKILNRKSVR